MVDIINSQCIIHKWEWECMEIIINNQCNKIINPNKCSHNSIKIFSSLNPNKINERITLMPGEYQLVIKPQNASRYKESIVKRFLVKAGETTNITF